VLFRIVRMCIGGVSAAKSADATFSTAKDGSSHISSPW
jgi:hypothetical protein